MILRPRRVLVSIALVSLVAAALSSACARQTAPLTPGAATAKVAPGKEATDGGPGGGSAASAAPPERPFAGSPAEATQLIGAAVDKRSIEVQKCVAEYRTRKNLPHERVSISMGIDQEGRLLGATLPKGKTDPVLSECVQQVLSTAPFPRSHSGVISITKSYEEIVQ